MKYPYLVLLLLMVCACNDSRNEDNPVAKVLDRYLFASEVADFITPGIPSQDSLLMAQSYIRSWVTKELLLNKALQNLSEEERNIRKQVEDYSSSILIHKYKDKLINQKVNMVISEDEIEEYYENNKINFVLNYPVLQALLIVIPKTASNLDNFRKWFISDCDEDQKMLEEYCLTNAKRLDNFNNKWIEIRYLINLLPISLKEWDNYKEKTHIEIDNDEYYYFLKINNYIPEQEIAPVGYVKQEIELILRNKRKLDFEDKFEREINQEGINKDLITIY